MSIKKGTTSIGSVYKGTTAIGKIYKGTTLIYESAKWLNYLFERLYHSLIPTTISSRQVKNKAKISKVYGDSVVENQLAKLDRETTTNSGITFTRIDDYTFSLNGTATEDITSLSLEFSYRQIDTSHKYLISGINGGSSTTYYYSINRFDNVYNEGIYSPTSNGQSRFNLTIKSGTIFNNKVFHIQLIDLTQMFPFDTPTTLTDVRVQALLNRGYIEYNTGEIKSVDISEFSTTKANTILLDTLPFIYQGNGAGTSHDTFEITNTEYVFTKNNAFRPYQSGDENDNTVLTDLTNTLYQLATPQVIHIPRKHLAVVDLGSLNWYLGSNNYGFASYNFVSTKNAKAVSNNQTMANLYCANYQSSIANNITGKVSDMIIGINVSGSLLIRDIGKLSLTADQFKSAMNGIYLFYETESEVADVSDQLDIEAGGTLNGNWFSWKKNQIMPNGNFESTSGWYSINATNSVSNNTLTVVKSSADTTYVYRANTDLPSVVANHKYLCSVYIKVSGNSSWRFRVGNNYGTGQAITSNTKTLLAQIMSPTAITGFNCSLSDDTGQLASGGTCELNNYQMIDLTLAFGSGNEPTSVDDPRIQYILSLGYIATDTTGTNESVDCQTLPNVEMLIKCK